jgi:uncharacterized protein (DUF1330 family)
MTAYVIVEIAIQNHEVYEDYKKLTPTSVAAYGGKFIARGGSTVALEGDWNPERIVILQFPSTEKAKEWWHSQEYAEAKALRQKSATTKMLLIEGCGSDVTGT